MSTAIIRPLLEEDMPQVVELDRKQSERFGLTPGLPDLFKFPIIAPQVLEQDGEIIGMWYFQAELCITSLDKRCVQAMVEHVPDLKAGARAHGVRYVMAEVVPQLTGRVDEYMQSAGFKKREGHQTFVLDIEESK